MQASSELKADAAWDSVSVNMCTEAFYNHEMDGWNINQGLFHFVVLCFLVVWFGFFYLINSRVQKRVTLLFETKDGKFMANLLNRLSIGVEQATLQECGELLLVQ